MRGRERLYPPPIVAFFIFCKWFACVCQEGASIASPAFLHTNACIICGISWSSSSQCVGWDNDAWMCTAYLMHILRDSDGERVQCLTWVDRQQRIRQDHLETWALCESRQWGKQPVCAACLLVHTHDYILYRSAHRARRNCNTTSP